MKKILLIDDKGINEADSIINLLNELSEEALEVIDFKDSADGHWMLNDNQDTVISFNIKLKDYAFIFIHDSHDNPILKSLTLLTNRLSDNTKLVLFSGGRKPHLSYLNDTGYKHDRNVNSNRHYEIKRSIYYKNFGHFIDCSLALGYYKVEALYNQNFSVKNEKARILFDEVMTLLEESESAAVNSTYFKDILNLAGYNSYQIEEVSSNYLKFDYQKFREILEDEVTKIR